MHRAWCPQYRIRRLETKENERGKDTLCVSPLLLVVLPFQFLGRFISRLVNRMTLIPLTLIPCAWIEAILAPLFAFPTSIALAPGLVPQIFKGQISGRPLCKSLFEVLATNGNVAFVPSNLNLLALANRFAGRIDS